MHLQAVNRQELRQGIAEFETAIRREPSRDAYRLSLSPYNLLLRPIAERLRTASLLVAIPDLFLSRAPLEALVDEHLSSDSGSVSSLPAIMYAPCLTPLDPLPTRYLGPLRQAALLSASA